VATGPPERVRPAPEAVDEARLRALPGEARLSRVGGGAADRVDASVGVRVVPAAGPRQADVAGADLRAAPRRSDDGDRRRAHRGEPLSGARCVERETGDPDRRRRPGAGERAGRSDAGATRCGGADRCVVPAAQRRGSGTSTQRHDGRTHLRSAGRDLDQVGCACRAAEDRRWRADGEHSTARSPGVGCSSGVLRARRPRGAPVPGRAGLHRAHAPDDVRLPLQARRPADIPPDHLQVPLVAAHRPDAARRRHVKGH
jgi:hypothetical protein